MKCHTFDKYILILKTRRLLSPVVQFFDLIIDDFFMEKKIQFQYIANIPSIILYLNINRKLRS